MFVRSIKALKDSVETFDITKKDYFLNLGSISNHHRGVIYAITCLKDRCRGTNEGKIALAVGSGPNIYTN